MPVTSIAIDWYKRSVLWIYMKDHITVGNGTISLNPPLYAACTNDGSGTARATIFMDVRDSNNERRILQAYPRVYFPTDTNKITGLTLTYPGTVSEPVRIIVYAVNDADVNMKSNTIETWIQPDVGVVGDPNPPDPNPDPVPPPSPIDNNLAKIGLALSAIGIAVTLAKGGKKK